MKKILYALVIALSSTYMAVAPATSQTIANSKQFGVVPPACEGDTQMALNICASRWAKTADFLRSLIYEEVYRQIPEARQSQLKAIEQTWTSYRDTHCRESSAPFKGGSIYPLIYSSCLPNVTNDRIADLQGKSNSQLKPDETAQRLAKILSQGNLKDSSSQKLWQIYQAQHCQFDSLRFTESSSVKQCRDRLAESRLLQLEAMMSKR
ncbi:MULTISPECIES: lysozyme inhibitor LprI family protein [Pseudanabaena]|uniref:Lysozyme inhibitor LprI-like N-terminal domain-containing protein n=2 Tax=Pseudanabaena TaxID=1152 RepID=L8MSL9_9CYAN|nr:MULTISPECIES: lysozyme inhibitor LprI family protein [Pseudanabaena]ELS30907.1 protein of unknown function DUF1311 [Pseudanabaena biceps PCC 7429]MDG3496827.1 lysozyme inhibitor LprI family protein [Pseudanabaena catenata USMAC16]